MGVYTKAISKLKGCRMAVTKKDETIISARIYARLSLLAAVVLLVAGGVLWGVGSFATTQVKQELSAQKIYFPPKGSPALDPAKYPDLQKYAGQLVDNGEKAKAYANGYIGRHLQDVAGGKTYAEVSALAMKDPSNKELEKQKQTLMQGETLRGILLGTGYAYGLMGALAKYAALAAMVLAATMTAIALRLRRYTKS